MTPWTLAPVEHPRAIVCGGRRYADKARVFEVLDEVRPREIAEGGDRRRDRDGIVLDLGADYFAWQWAQLRGVPVRTYDAEWTKFGSRAGPIRNIRMLQEFKPEAVIAFPGRRGTADMSRRATKARLPLLPVDLAPLPDPDAHRPP